ncbi:hypothetical protein [Nioella ostreopsis]|uniref:hypothetical protein n=1 Tax=Nioella ostreopsis TaxID=2448479 RepID=UPI000FD7ACBC|nr:hypothetical protein [Nioella ostreopsis]
MTIPSFSHDVEVLLQSYVEDLAATPATVLAEISNFNWLWPIFESKCCNGNACKASIEQFCSNYAKRYSADDFDTELGYFRERYRSENAEATSHLDKLLSHRGQGLKDSILVGLCEQAEPDSKMKALVLIVYRLRNNLFHGTKGGLGFTDQLDNFVHANRVLIEIIKKTCEPC